MARLSREFRVYLADRPGHGLADIFDYHGIEILPHAVAFLRGILDGLGVKRAPVVGNSMGGRWAIELALRDPDKVSHLVLPGLPAGAARKLPARVLRGARALTSHPAAGGRDARPLYDGQTIFERALSEGIGVYGQTADLVAYFIRTM